tara:strand:- start:4555 stop:6402 length:1848 start_codon:yes stop_codon:yes gene_type:complete
MAQNLNYTNIFFSISPSAYGSLSHNNGGYVYDVYGGNTDVLLHSVNSDMTYQIWWQDTNLTQAQEGTGSSGERIAGDLVNVVFNIYEYTTQNTGAFNTSDMNLVASIKKSKDIPKRWNGRKNENPTLEGHRFTVDISDICADLLSFSLVPNNTGTWGGLNTLATGPTGGMNASSQPNLYGGLNGQFIMEDIALVATTSAASMHNLTANGADRRIRVEARFEVMKSDGTLEISDSPSNRYARDIYIVNSAWQWEDKFNHITNEVRRYGSGREFLTNSPNMYYSASSSDLKNEVYYKKVELESQAEFLQWWQRDLPYISSGAVSDCDAFAIEVQVASTKAGLATGTKYYLVDFMMGGRAAINANGKIDRSQYRQFVQNVSPDWINKHNNGTNKRYDVPSYVANPISSSNKFYRLRVVATKASSATVETLTSHYYYELDLQGKGAWMDTLGFQDGVKFMWLNRMGGIDTYTAKFNMTASVDVTQEVIMQKSPDRKHPKKSDADVANNSIGTNMYANSRQAINVSANRSFTVFTDPLTVIEAKWLEEILTSPNVWVMKKNSGSNYYKNLSTTNQARPAGIGYIPVLVTNGGTTLVDEENGLVQVNIEFSESHEVNTQRN